MSTILLVVGILVFLIVVHELGHFVASKFFKVRVEEFGIGYPPRAFTFGRWGGTEYTLNWIPFGGFVRLLGEHGETRERGAFASAPKYAQAIILIAGVAMNALTAWFLFAGALHAGVPRQVPEGKALTNDVQLFVNRVIDGSPAAVAGLNAGDEILAITDDTSGAAAALVPSRVVEFVGERGGKRLELTYRRADETATVFMTPANAVIEDEASRPAVGFGMILVTDAQLPWWRALIEAGPMTWQSLKDTVNGLWELVRDAVMGNPNLQNIVGPVGLVDFVGNASEHGLGHVLVLAGFISINLAVINLIPVPALDGGRLLLLGIEVMLRRPPHSFAVKVANLIGVGIIVFLMIGVTWNDIARLLA